MAEHAVDQHSGDTEPADRGDGEEDERNVRSQIEVLLLQAGSDVGIEKVVREHSYEHDGKDSRQAWNAQCPEKWGYASVLAGPERRGRGLAH